MVELCGLFTAYEGLHEFHVMHTKPHLMVAVQVLYVCGLVVWWF